MFIKVRWINTNLSSKWRSCVWFLAQIVSTLKVVSDAPMSDARHCYFAFGGKGGCLGPKHAQHNTMHTAQNFRQIKRLVVCNRWDVSVAFRTAKRSDPTLLSTVPYGSKRWNLTPAGVCLTLEKWRLLDVGGGLVPGVQQALWSLQFVPVWVTWIIRVVVSTHYIVLMYRDDIQL